MKKIETNIKGVYVLEPEYHGDNRGWFVETYNKETFHNIGIDDEFVQDNCSYSAVKGTLRGLHYQKAPYCQSKLVRCTKGRVIDVAVDIRKGSPTYGKWISQELSEDNKLMFYIPHGFAHGFLTLSDEVEFQYKCDNLYNKDSEGSIKYNDPTINVDWGSLLEGIDPILSKKDKNAPSLEECNANFVLGENC